MFVWMSYLLNLSRMWYTENQRKCFFEKVDDLYMKYCVDLIKEYLPADKAQETEKKIRDGVNIQQLWDETCPDNDFEHFEREKVYPAMFDDLAKNGYYWKEIFLNAPPENIEDWYACSDVKSLLHEFVNDKEDPYKIVDSLSVKEIACLSYTLYSFYIDFLKKHLHVSDEDADYALNILYCGEFAQNEWLNFVFQENKKKIRHKVTEIFLSVFLARKYSRGMRPPLFREFINEEVMSPIYVAIYESRYEILNATREYLAQSKGNKWSPEEMDNVYKYVAGHVKLDFKAPDFSGYV